MPLDDRGQGPGAGGRRKIVVGIFDSGEKVLHAARAARDGGLAIHDVYTPFPVHGMDKAMGLAPSRLTAVCLGLGAAGALCAFGFQEWAFDLSWPMNIGGKPLNAWPAYVPITFELMVLSAGVGTVLTFLYWRRLLPMRKPSLSQFGATNDRFLLALKEAHGAHENAAALKRFLESQGASKVHEAEAQ